MYLPRLSAVLVCVRVCVAASAESVVLLYAGLYGDVYNVVAVAPR